MRYYLLAIITFALLSPSVAIAEDKNNLADATYINFSTVATKEVPNDYLTSVLRVEQDGDDAKLLQSNINDLTSKAIALAKKYPAISLATDQYYVYQYDKSIEDSKKKGAIKKMWRGGQNLTLNSTSIADELQLIGELQATGLIMQNMNYSVSTEKLDSIRDSMIEETLVKLNEKGARFAKILNKEYKGLSWVNIDTTNGNQPTMLMGAASSQMNKAIAPVGEAGMGRVSITITTTAVMK